MPLNRVLFIVNFQDILIHVQIAKQMFLHNIYSE